MGYFVSMLFAGALVATGCKPPVESRPVESSLTVEGPPPRVVPDRTPIGSRTTAGALLSIPSVFKPIPERTTDDLIAEVEHPGTKDRLPLLAELATRTKDKEKIIPAVRTRMSDGRYAVRVLAIMVCIAVDQERPGDYATELNVRFMSKAQMPVYGPIQEDTPELRRVRKLAAPNLVKILEKELADKNPQQPQTGGILTILATFPKDLGAPAVDAVKRISTTPAHPNAVQADQLLKSWGAN